MLRSILIIATTFALSYGQSGDFIRVARPLSSPNFDEIIVSGSFDVFLSQNAPNMGSTVDVEAPADIQSRIIVEIISGHILSVRVNQNIFVNQAPRVFIRFGGVLRRYTVEGAGNTVSEGNTIVNPTNDKFVIDNQGAANVALQFDVQHFEAVLSGAGQNRFSGQVRQQAKFDVQGARNVDALNLICRRVSVETSGATRVQVSAIDDIAIDASGVSTVLFRLPAGREPSMASTSGVSRIQRIP
jgi:hypothetical protein